jgi:hypothetical protein
VVTILTTLLNNQKLCPQSEFQNFVRFLQNTVLPLTTLTQLHPQAYLYTLLLQIKVITGIHLYNKQTLLEVILLPPVNYTVKLHNLIRSLLFCNVTQCWLLVTDVLGLTVHPETSVTNYQSMLPNIPEAWISITPWQKPQIMHSLVNHEICRWHMKTSKILFSNSQTRNIGNNHNHFFLWKNTWS